MSARVIKGTLTAHLNEYRASYIGPKELAEMPEAQLSQELTYAAQDMTSVGWTKVGEAEVVITLQSSTEILANSIAALRAEQQKTLADAQEKATKIEKKIQTLLAISFDEVQA